MKKEIAVDTVLTALPFLKPENVDVKLTYLKILPVLFSYVSLYDIKIIESQNIVDLLQVHSAFVYDQW